MTARTSAGVPRAGPTLSRRALLFGLPGLRGRDRAAEDCVARPAGPAVASDAGGYATIGRRLEPAADTLVRACGVAPGQAWLDVAAGDGNFALAAARAGAEVVAVDAASLPVEQAAFDGVASNFGIIHAPDSRRVVEELERALVPGGLAAVTAWTASGFMGGILRLVAEAEGRGSDRPRPERWGQYEGVQLAFSRFPGFEARDESLRWQFESPEAVWVELVTPPGPLSAAAAAGRVADGFVRDRVLALVDRHGRRDGDGVVIDVGYLLVLARKPEWAPRRSKNS